MKVKAVAIAIAASFGEIIHDQLYAYLTRTGAILHAKVSGPMFSLDARGKFAGALVFSSWKGRPVVRQLVTPANPQSVDQQVARNIVRVFGAAQHFANDTLLNGDGRPNLDKTDLIAVAPAGYAWNGNLVKVGTGANQINYDAAVTAWGTITAGQDAVWTTAAEALVPAIPEVAQIGEDGVAEANMVAGKVFFIYQYALYLLGVRATAPNGTPAVYA